MRLLSVDLLPKAGTRARPSHAQQIYRRYFPGVKPCLPMPSDQLPGVEVLAPIFLVWISCDFKVSFQNNISATLPWHFRPWNNHPVPTPKLREVEFVINIPSFCWREVVVKSSIDYRLTDMPQEASMAVDKNLGT